MIWLPCNPVKVVRDARWYRTSRLVCFLLKYNASSLRSWFTLFASYCNSTSRNIGKSRWLGWWWWWCSGEASACHSPCSIEGLVLLRCVTQLIPEVLSGIDRIASWPNRSIVTRDRCRKSLTTSSWWGRALSSWKTACYPICCSVGTASCRRISSRYWRSVRLPCTLHTGVLWWRRTVKSP